MSHKINLYLKRGKYYKEDEEQECGQKGRETAIWVMYMWLGKMQKAEIKRKEQAHHGGEGQEKG